MICTSIQNRNYGELLDILASPEIEMAEIRLDSCTLADDEIEDIFGNSDKPLIATCRISGTLGAAECERRLRLAAEAGARFADLEIEAPAEMSKNFQKFCRKSGTEIIRSYHNFESTPDIEVLQKALARCFRYGADIAKIVCFCNSPEDAGRIESLYSIVLEDFSLKTFSAPESDPSARRINVADLSGRTFPTATLRIDCSKGTYIRALARDLGEALGSGAFLSSLRRTVNGGFGIGEALSLGDALAMFGA